MQAVRKNDAEHSWHLALMAVLLKEYSNEEVDLAKVIPMVLIHDLVEIDAGDTYAYDEAGAEDRSGNVKRKQLTESLDCFRADQGNIASGNSGRNLRHTKQRRRNLPMCWTIAQPLLLNDASNGTKLGGTWRPQKSDIQTK